MTSLLKRKNQRGATMPEYALMIALIAVVCIVAVRAVGTSSSEKFQEVAGEIAGVTTTP